MKLERKRIKAVYDEELEPFLKSLKLWEPLQNHTLRCAICNEIITFDNFGGVYKKNGKVRVFCNKPLCYSKIFSEQNARVA